MFRSGDVLSADDSSEAGNAGDVGSVEDAGFAEDAGSVEDAGSAGDPEAIELPVRYAPCQFFPTQATHGPHREGPAPAPEAAETPAPD